tara:strand:+ start:281 stop:1609 length:1329 start_codon:yes stop_codon:yes gene_type:complete
MKLIAVSLALFFLYACSFDNKTGIWKNSKDSSSASDPDLFDDFKPLISNEDTFDKIIPIKKGYRFKTPKKIINKEWQDIYYNDENNFDNFTLNREKNLKFKSKKISKNKINEFFLYHKDSLIFNDQKGNIIIFSIKENKVLNRFNFYKKRYRKIKKNLNLTLSEDTIYVTDNIGFVYAYDFIKNKIIWAKNNKIPFRSNLKIFKDKLIAADQNNNVYILNKKNGNTIKLIPTEDTQIKNSYKNNFSLNKNNIFLLNTYGSLYAIDSKSNEVSWVLNLNQSIDMNPRSLFNGNQLVNNNEVVVVTSHEATYIIDAFTGTLIHKFNIISKIKPLIVNNHLFIISENNLLICLDIFAGQVVYSYNINQKIAEFLEIKEKEANFKSIMIANDRIIILLKNSYFLEANINGNLESVFKFKNKINSNLIFLDSSILYLNRKNRVVIIG